MKRSMSSGERLLRDRQATDHRRIVRGLTRLLVRHATAHVNDCDRLRPAGKDGRSVFVPKVTIESVP